MRNIWLGLIITVVALALGIGAAAGALALWKMNAASSPSISNSFSPGMTGGWGGPGYMMDEVPGDKGCCDWDEHDDTSDDDWMHHDGWGGHGSMRGGYYRSDDGWQGSGHMMGEWYDYDEEETRTLERITMEDAVVNAGEYLSAVDNDGELEIMEVMEFEDNFYVVVVEEDSGKGAFELLVHPYSGAISPEPGPNMMWNQKYGHHARQGSASLEVENDLSLEQAKSLAQQTLDENVSNAEVEGMGIDFYGYYTFDYQVDGQPAGMLSVHGSTGQVWQHTWHGEFIDEKEMHE